MKILFHITGYRLPEQFAWLYQALYNKKDLFIIHIDKKTPPHIYNEFLRITDGHVNTHFIPRIKVTWGSTGLIRAELEALKLGLRIDNDWRYLVNLTAQDYLISSVEKIRKELVDAWPDNFVMSTLLKETHWRIRKRCWFNYCEIGDRRYFTPLPSLRQARLKIHRHGPWWHVLTRDFCEWWTTHPKADQYYRALEFAGMPDELLIQNLIHDSPFAQTVRSECKHEIIWRYPGESVRTTAHPRVLTVRDLDILENSTAFFARKFDASVDRAVLERLAHSHGLPIPSGLIDTEDSLLIFDMLSPFHEKRCRGPA